MVQMGVDRLERKSLCNLLPLLLSSQPATCVPPRSRDSMGCPWLRRQSVQLLRGALSSTFPGAWASLLASNLMVLLWNGWRIGWAVGQAANPQ